jgi:GntR family transcriptional regulator
VVLDDITLAAERFPGLNEKVFRERDSTIYQLYQERYGINVVRSAERLSAALADRPSAKLLGVLAGSPLLRIKRTALTYHNVPVELRTSLVNTAEHEYFSDLGKN